MMLLLYFVLAILVVGLSIVLSNYVDLLDKKTNLSGALLGGILLAAVTSLPELFTSITGTLIVGENKLVLGNILGSNLFDIVLFFIIYIFFFANLVKSKITKNHLFSLVFIGLMYVAISIACFVFDKNNILLGYFNPISILILIIYCISIWKTPKVEEDKEEEEVKSKLTVKQIWLLFTLFSILLIGASIAITIVTDKVVEELGIGATFGGALFLGVATSIPEMTATINLSRKKNYNAAMGDVLGSCIFNCIILSIADVLSFNTPTTLFKIDQSSFLLIAFTIVPLILIFISIYLLNKKKISNLIGYRVFFLLIGLFLIGSYVAYTILSNVNLGISFAPFN